MAKHERYGESDLNLLLHEPWEISDRPYMLHAAYALSCLFEVTEPVDDDEDKPFTRDDIWGCTVPKKILERLVADIAESFNDAARNGKRIDVWGKSYSIRKCNAYDPKRIHLIFDFQLKDGEYIISKDGIMNLHGPVIDMLKKYELTLDEARANKLYLRQIIRLAEDDRGGGWNKLTDMEIILYCWALFYSKHQSDNILEFQNIYKDYMYVGMDEIRSCLTDKALFMERPQGLYTFSERKVKEWNIGARQKSYASEISKEEADDYWYDVALKSSCKPIDRR